MDSSESPAEELPRIHLDLHAEESDLEAEVNIDWLNSVLIESNGRPPSRS
jgi:hypothetical protein